MLGSNEGNSIVQDTCQTDLEKVERNAEAAKSSTIKVSNSINQTKTYYCHQGLWCSMRCCFPQCGCWGAISGHGE